MKKKLKLTLILALTGLLLVTATACDALGGGEEAAAPLPVEVIRGDLAITITGSGSIEASREVKLTFGSAGKVDRLPVEVGDKVSAGAVLARLDTSALELARSQAEVALVQAELAVTQAELAQQTAESNLQDILDSKDALELALLNTQIAVRNAEYHVDETMDIYTWPEIEVAKKDVLHWKAYIDYIAERLDNAETTSEQNKWSSALVYAQSRLTIAESKLDTMVRSYDTEEVVIAKLQLEAAEMAESQAQQNLDDLANDIALQELPIAATKQSTAQAQKSVALAQQSLAQAQKQLNEATITAPFAGIVASVGAEEGEFITTVTTIISLVDTNTMELLVEMDEIDIPGIELDQEAIIEIDALPDTPFHGKVSIIYPLPRTVGGIVLYDVKVDIEVPRDAKLRVGMSASVDIIITQRSDVLLVPSRAISLDEQGNSIVKVKTDEGVVERKVVTGITDELQTEIISGLNEGETVLIEIKAKATSESGLFF